MGKFDETRKLYMEFIDKVRSGFKYSDELENLPNMEYMYVNDAHYLRDGMKCYKSDTKENASSKLIVFTLDDVSDSYNFLELSDGKYIDGFVFPLDMDINNSDCVDSFVSCIVELDNDRKMIEFKNRLEKKIPLDLLEKYITKLKSNLDCKKNNVV